MRYSYSLSEVNQCEEWGFQKMTEACDLAENCRLQESRKRIERRQQVLLQSSGPHINLADGWRLTLAEAYPLRNPQKTGSDRDDP
jgi:hypothetical protein